MSELRRVLNESVQDPAEEIIKKAREAGADVTAANGRALISPRGSDITISASYAMKPVSIDIGSKVGPIIHRNYGSLQKFIDDIPRLVAIYKSMKGNDLLFGQAMTNIEKKIGRRWKFGPRVPGRKFTASRNNVRLEIEYFPDKSGG